MPNVFEQLKAKAQSRKRRIVFPETHDRRVIDAIRALSDKGLVDPVLIWQNDIVAEEDLSGLEIVSSADTELLKHFADQLFENRKHKGLSPEALKDGTRYRESGIVLRSSAGTQLK